MVKVSSIASIRVGSAVRLAVTLIIAGALLHAVPAGAQCDPTCGDTCDAQLKACKGAAQFQNKMNLANCALIQKMGNANCAFLALIYKTVACLDTCGLALDTCKLGGKHSVELCKLDTKAGVTTCKDDAKQQLQQNQTDCQTALMSCRLLCP